MSITGHKHGRQVTAHDGTRLLVAAGAAVTGVLGYGIAVGLARASRYAEQVEEDEYCHPADVPLQR